MRLHIRKATLREWRREFARHLRALGIAANATDRGVRGESRSPKRDGIYRAVDVGALHNTVVSYIRFSLHQMPGYKAMLMGIKEGTSKN